MRIRQVDALILMDIADEDLPLIVESMQQSRIAAIETVKAHPSKADALFAGMGDQKDQFDKVELKVWVKATIQL